MKRKKAIRKAQAVANAARGITDDLAELDMDNYDNDDSYDEDVQERQLFGKMNSEFESNQDDPYVTIKDSDDDEEEENPDDFGILKNDLVVLARESRGRCEPLRGLGVSRGDNKRGDARDRGEFVCASRRDVTGVSVVFSVDGLLQRYRRE